MILRKNSKNTSTNKENSPQYRSNSYDFEEVFKKNLIFYS